MAASEHQAALAACAISSWYPAFRHVTFKTVLIDLPQDFLDYLVADGVHLAEDSEAVSPSCLRLCLQQCA